MRVMYYNVQSVQCVFEICMRARPTHSSSGAQEKNWSCQVHQVTRHCLKKKNILLFQQIHPAIWTNTFCHAKKYILQFVQIHFRMKTHSSDGAAHRKTCKFIGSQDISGGSKCRIFRLGGNAKSLE